MSYNMNMQTPIRPTLEAEKSDSTGTTYSIKKTNEKFSGGKRGSGYSPDQERRISQRDKQVSYGYVTDGYRNMIKLVQHDPLLKSGGILPLSPPDLNKGSKRAWDVSLRKWRRALHMFDSVFIEGEDEGIKTLKGVIEEQRLQWVSPAFLNTPKEKRLLLSAEKIREARKSPFVPTKLPVEENLKIILRNEDCYEPVSNVVPPSASSLIKGADISHQDAGIKIFVAPSAHSQLLSTPDKPEIISYQETPQNFKYNVNTPGQFVKSPSSLHTFSTFSPVYYPRPIGNNLLGMHSTFLPHDSKYESPNHQIYQQSRSSTTENILHTMTHQVDHVFAPPAYVQPPPPLPPPTLQGGVVIQHNSGLPSNLEWMRTPVTAPRRVTLLHSSGKERKIGDTELLQRNLFPNNMTPSYNPTVNEKENNINAPSTKSFVNDKSSIENDNTGYPVVDSISQNLFPEQ